MPLSLSRFAFNRVPALGTHVSIRLSISSKQLYSRVEDRHKADVPVRLKRLFRTGNGRFAKRCRAARDLLELMTEH